MINPSHIRTAKDNGLQVRHDMLGWYICTDKEGEHEDDGHSSVGFDGREHWPDIDEAWAAAANSTEDNRSPEQVRIDLHAKHGKTSP